MLRKARDLMKVLERTSDRLNTSKAGTVWPVEMGGWVYSYTCLAFHQHGAGQYSELNGK